MSISMGSLVGGVSIALKPMSEDAGLLRADEFRIRTSVFFDSGVLGSERVSEAKDWTPGPTSLSFDVDFANQVLRVTCFFPSFRELDFCGAIFVGEG
jgi:hypothetical protein